jgi:sulfur-oxidizing protein SoxY
MAAYIGCMSGHPLALCASASLARAALALMVCAASVAYAQDAPPEASAIWQKVHASVFAGASIEDAAGVITLDTPRRAEDAAIVPVAIRSTFAQTPAHFIEKIWLIVDDNPSPIAAVFSFTVDSGRADIETRIRIEQYTWVRAIALTQDGKLHMAANYVKASGGCSAPAGKDAIAARANLGRMRLRIADAPAPGEPVLAQLMVSHPNDSGLAMDQVTRLYAAPHFVRRVDVRYGGKTVMSADVDFSISENPNFRFYVVPGAGGELQATIVDNRDLEFATAVRLDPGRGGTASTVR